MSAASKTKVTSDGQNVLKLICKLKEEEINYCPERSICKKRTLTSLVHVNASCTLRIVIADLRKTFNKRNEIRATCRHGTKFKLTSIQQRQEAKQSGGHHP